MNPKFSVIIPTRNSGKYLVISLGALRKQKGVEFEIIIADNNSTDDTKIVAKNMKARVVNISGSPPQVSAQRNIGAEAAKGDYVLFLDHDMELPVGFLKSLSDQISNAPGVDAWYIPERMQASSHILSKMRTFENSQYVDTPIVAARVIKKKSFNKTDGYDVMLSGGPADWDLDLQLRVQNCTFATVDGYLKHHEESLTYLNYIKKKRQYRGGIELYKRKWKRINMAVYEKHVMRQFSPWYRLVVIFFENEKWKKTLMNLHLYLLFLITRFFMFWYY